MKRDKTHAPIPTDPRYPLCNSYGWARIMNTERWPDDEVTCAHCLRLISASVPDRRTQ